MLFKIYYILLVGVVFLSSCSKQAENEKIKKASTPKKKEGLVVSYFKGTKNVRAEINYSNGIKHGLAKDYYKNGQLRMAINYNQGEKDSLFQFFHENGQLYKESMYTQGVLHGFERLYYNNGQLMLENKFHNGLPCIGYKEFTKKGKQKKFPEILISEVNTLAKNGKVTIKLQLTNNSKKVDFFVDEDKNTECLDFDSSQSLFYVFTRDGVGTMEIDIPSGMYLAKKLEIFARYTSVSKQKVLLKKKYNLYFENSY